MLARVLKSSTSPKNAMLIGQCIAHEIPSEAKVRVNVLEFDSHLKLYFTKYSDFIAHDQGKKCKDGDIVLLKKLQTQVKTHINHSIIKILYPLGDVTDPISGKKCVVGTYRETMKYEKELYGKAEDAAGGFDYDSAPDRGWQEGKKDFTHKPGYNKFHEFPEGHPKHNDGAAM